eukprot:4066338-Amphidinium_carterae.1
MVTAALVIRKHSCVDDLDGSASERRNIVSLSPLLASCEDATRSDSWFALRLRLHGYTDAKHTQ